MTGREQDLGQGVTLLLGLGKSQLANVHGGMHPVRRGVLQLCTATDSSWGFSRRSSRGDAVVLS